MNTKPKRSLLLTHLVAIALLLTAAVANADTVKLKSGITHEGKLISETTDSIRFEVGKSVKQVRTFKRSEIETLTVIPPDEVALPEIAAMIPTPDLLDAGEYSRMIEGAPKNFLRAFPTSKHRNKVEKVIATLEEERKKILAGGIKVDGTWLTKEDIAADPYNHGARIEKSELDSLIANGDMLDSLKKFTAIEEKFPDSASYPEAVAAVKELLPKHLKALDTQLAKTTAENKRREVAYSRMRPDDRTKAEAEYKRQLAPFLKRHAEEKAAKERWLDYHVWDLGSIADAQTEAKTELARLEKIDPAALQKRANALQQAAKLAATGDYSGARAQIKTIGKIKPGSTADKLNKSIIDGAKAADKAAAEAKASAERKKRIAAREAATAKATEVAKTKKPTPTEPAKMPAPVNVSTAHSDDAVSMDDDGVSFDRTAGETAKPGGGVSFLTFLMIIIPIMAIATFLAIRHEKNNQIEDFVPNDPEEDETTA